MRSFVRVLFALVVVTIAVPVEADEVRQRAQDPSPKVVVTPQISVIKVKVESVARSGSGPITSRTMDADFRVKSHLATPLAGNILRIQSENGPIKKTFDLPAGPSEPHVIVTVPTPDLCTSSGYQFRFETADADRFEVDPKIVRADSSGCTFTGTVVDPWLSMSPDNAAPLLATDVHVSAFTVDHAPVCGQSLGYHATVQNPSATNGSVMLRVFDSDGLTKLAHHGPFAVPPHSSVKVSFGSIFAGHAGKLSLRIEEVNKAIPATDVRYLYAVTASSCSVDFKPPMTVPMRDR